MKTIKDYINYNLSKEYLENFLLEDIKFSLSCWIKTFKVIPISYNVPKIFESAGQFNNCGEIIKLITNYVWDNRKEEKYTKEFYTKEYDVFFDKFIINVENNSDNTYGYYDELKNKTLSLGFHIKKYPKHKIDFISTIEYTIIHELMHAYEDSIRDKMGLPSINKFMEDPKYRYEYQRALRFMKFSEKEYEEDKEEYILTLLAKMKYINIINNIESFQIENLKYFLNDQERKAYLGTLKTCVHNVSKS